MPLLKRENRSEKRDSKSENMSARNDLTESKTKEDDNRGTKEDDSGFQSGFQDSCEILSSEVIAADKDTDMPQGNSRDKENFTDSGIISSGYISHTESEVITELWVPDYLTGALQPKTYHQSIEKYFEQDEDGFTKLHIAILHNIEPAINALISLAPDSSYLNIRNFCGQTGLHLAVILRQHMTVKKLINAGADVNIRDNRCNTALHLACLNENVWCVQTIISAVYPQKEKKLLANLEQWNYEGETCFFIACRVRNMQIIRALETNGANVNAREGRSGYTALHMAVEMKANDVIKFLCEKCHTLSIDTENYGGLTAFQIALLTEQEPLLSDYLISRGATPYYTEDSDMEDDSSDFSGDELEKNQIISKIAEIVVN